MKKRDSEKQGANLPGSVRRDFIKTVGIGALSLPLRGYLNFADESVAIVIDANDSIAMSGSAQWAVSELISTLTDRDISVKRYNNISEATSAGLCLMVSGAAFQKTANIPAVALS